MKKLVAPRSKSRFKCLKYFAVFRGNNPGVYAGYSAAKPQVENFLNPRMKGYRTKKAAVDAYESYMKVFGDNDKEYKWSYSAPRNNKTLASNMRKKNNGGRS